MVLLGGLLAAISDQAAGDHDDAFELRSQGRILALEDILARQRRDHDGRVLDVELDHAGERLVYELEILDADGIVWELRYDAVTGQPVSEERD